MEIWFFYAGIALVYVVFALSLNLLLGFAGQVSVAHAAFGAIGGYTVGYLTLNRDWNVLPALLIGIGIAFVVGTVVALPAMRLSAEYLILLTLAISSVIIGAFTTFPELGGTYGLINLPTAELFGWTLARPRDWILPLFVVAAFTYWLTDRLGESPYGRVLRGIREDGQAVQSLGKNVFRFKLSVFAITSALAALAGGLFSAFERLATPSLFGFAISLTIFAMVILGGMGNLTGSVVGAVVLASLDPILTRAIGISADKAFFVQFIAYGLLLVVMMRLRPEGVLPEGFSLLRWVRRESQPIAGRVEMVRSEGWVPKVSSEVAQLARAEHEFLDETATITAGATVTGNGDAERARAGLWAAAPVVLQVAGLSKRFGGIVAADDLTFTLRQGSIVALVGPNGAGKTTVFNLLTGFIPPDRGSVRLRGVELVGSPPDEIARMGIVRSFQDVRLFQRLSCVTNVAMAVPGQPGERVPSLLARHGVVRRSEADAIERARDWLTFVGMQELADIPTGALSYGQTKLVSLARVLATEAEVILLDEPASGIDDVWVDTMLGLIESLRERGRTICIVEHNLHVVGRLADHTYFMELGRITAEGTIGELTGSERLAEAYFGTV